MADPDERTAAERIDATRWAARSLTFLLEAIERELVATPLQIARLQGRWRPSARSPESYRRRALTTAPKHLQH
jgi:hypothetical protein